ncbi:MAG: MerR family transcriptional regulator [Rickettsiales bacterium]|jgi:DNA-binding transcriptional MerR regulator|nr:MerR family transcriptional regulator [Rickettsiales bacterium]
MSEPFISINELSKRLIVPAHTLRYWEKQFPTAIRPTTGAGGRRYYREDTAAIIAQIKSLLHDQGYTIAGVRKLVNDGKLGNLSVANNMVSSRPPAPHDRNDALVSEIDAALELLDKAAAELAAA